MVRLFLLSREGPVETVDIECGELIEEQVEEIWWLRKENGNGKSNAIFHHRGLQATKYLYVRTFVMKPFLIVISVSDINVPKCWEYV